MKSAERYKYEANCNAERRDGFIALLYTNVIASLLVENGRVAFGLMLGAFGSGIGMEVSHKIANVKHKRSGALTLDGSVPNVPEKHFRTRRRLYKDPTSPSEVAA